MNRKLSVFVDKVKTHSVEVFEFGMVDESRSAYVSGTS